MTNVVRPVKVTIVQASSNPFFICWVIVLPVGIINVVRKVVAWVTVIYAPSGFAEVTSTTTILVGEVERCIPILVHL